MTTSAALSPSAQSCNLTDSTGRVIWSALIDAGDYFASPGSGGWASAIVLTTIDGTVGDPIKSFSSFPRLGDVVRDGNSQYLAVIYVSLTTLPPGLVIDPQNGTLSGVPTGPFDGQVQFALQNSISKELSETIGTITFRISPLTLPSSLSPAAYAVPAAFGAFVLFLIPVVLFLRERRKNKLKPHNFEEMLAALQDIHSDGEKRAPREIKRACVKLVDKLGEGQFGEVHKGLLNEIVGIPGYLVAVKSVKSAIDGLEAQRGPMLQEAALMAQFNHRHVVSLIGVVTVGEPLLVLLEYCEHGSLHKYLEHTELDDFRRIQVASDCAEGMTYLAAHNFVHRDLAARNVLLDSEYRCKIADFGMSREILDEKYYKSKGGQLPIRWTAPEALEDNKFSEQSDVWSFGVLLWEIWSKAEMPFRGMNNQKVWTEVMNGHRLQQPSGCPDAIYKLMHMCWFSFGHRPVFRDVAEYLQFGQSNELTDDSPNGVSTGSPDYVDSLQPPVPPRGPLLLGSTDEYEVPTGSGKVASLLQKSGATFIGHALPQSATVEAQRCQYFANDAPCSDADENLNYSERVRKWSPQETKPKPEIKIQRQLTRQSLYKEVVKEMDSELENAAATEYAFKSTNV